MDGERKTNGGREKTKRKKQMSIDKDDA